MFKRSCKEAIGKNIEQVLFTSIIIISDGKSYCPLNKIMSNQKARKIFHTPENCPDPPLIDSGLKEIPRDACTSLARFALVSLS